MTPDNHKAFSRMWRQTYAAITYHDMPVSHPSITVAFNALQEYSLDRIEQLLIDVATTTSNGRMPAVGALLERLGHNNRAPEMMTSDELLNLAHAHNTPLGCFIYGTLTAHTMQMLSRPVQLQHIEYHRNAIANFISAYSNGTLTDRQMHYLKVMGFSSSIKLLATDHQPKPTLVESIEDPDAPIALPHAIKHKANKVSQGTP